MKIYGTPDEPLWLIEIDFQGRRQPFCRDGDGFFGQIRYGVLAVYPVAAGDDQDLLAPFQKNIDLIRVPVGTKGYEASELILNFFAFRFGRRLGSGCLWFDRFFGS